MQLKIKLIDGSLPMPSYQTEGSAAFDLYSRIDCQVQSKQVRLIPLNVVMQLPKDHWLLMSARSSLHKQGLMMINGIGVGDYDYRGASDEYHAALYNFTDQPAQIKKGQRLVQAIVLPRQKMELLQIDDVEQEQSRGGFGSTG